MFLLCGGEMGLSWSLAPGGRGCWGNMLGGRGCRPGGNPANTGPWGGGRWWSIADSTAGWPGGLDRSWGAQGGGMEGGLEMEASLNRCSVNEAL